MHSRTFLSLLMVAMLSACQLPAAEAPAVYFIRLYDKPGWKGFLVQKNFHLGKCTSWLPAVGIYVRSAATQVPGMKCTIYAKHDDCNGDGHTFDSAVYDLQASGYPTFWRSFKCVSALFPPEDTQQDFVNVTSTTSDISPQGSTGITPSEAEVLSSRNDKATELSENTDDSASTNEKWKGCPPSVAGVPLNHCGGSAGSRFSPSTMLKLAVGAGAVAMLLWLQ